MHTVWRVNTYNVDSRDATGQDKTELDKKRLEMGERLAGADAAGTKVSHGEPGEARTAGTRLVEGKEVAGSGAGVPRWSPRVWAILVVLCGALFLDALDVSMVGVALPSIRADLGLTTSALQWVVSGYVLGYGGLLLLGGRAADLLGRRRVFLVALAVFALVSVLGGLVSSPGLL